MTRTYRVTDRRNGTIHFADAESQLAAVEAVAARVFGDLDRDRPTILDLDAEAV